MVEKSAAELRSAWTGETPVPTQKPPSPQARPARRVGDALADSVQGLPEIGDQVLHVFYTYRVPDESFRDAAGGALFWRGLDMAGRRRRTRNRFNRAQVCREVRIA